MGYRIRCAALMVLALAFSCSGVQAQTGVVMAAPKFVAYDNSGDPLASGRLYTYQCGTTTALTTYSDSALSVANANPTVLDSAGRATVYVPAGLCVKYVLKTSADVTLWTQDNVTTQPALDHSRCDGRLTLTSGTAVTSSDVTAATSVYFTPFKGNRCALYDATLGYWGSYTFTERTLSIAGFTATTLYDVFLYNNSGTLTLEAVAWSGPGTRATGITLQDGVYVKSGATTRRYLGTFRTTGSVGQTEDSATKRFVWNYYNRVRRHLYRHDSTDSWTYTTATFRQANGTLANQVEVVTGVEEGLLDLRVAAAANNGSGDNTVLVKVGIGEDSTTVDSSQVSNAAEPANFNDAGVFALLVKIPTIGYHYYAWLEWSQAASTTNWSGDNGGNGGKSGLSGWIEG